jgi:hypothetical protein
VRGKRSSSLELIEPGADHRSDTRLDPRHPLSIQSAQFRPGEAVRSTDWDCRTGRAGATVATGDMTVSGSLRRV